MASNFCGSIGSKTQSLRWNLLVEVLKGFVKDSQQYRGVLSTKAGTWKWELNRGWVQNSLCKIENRYLLLIKESS